MNLTDEQLILLLADVVVTLHRRGHEDATRRLTTDAEALAQEILRDPTFREELRGFVREIMDANAELKADLTWERDDPHRTEIG